MISELMGTQIRQMGYHKDYSIFRTSTHSIHMIKTDCNEICGDIINSCDYEIIADTDHEAKELIQAHLRQSHPDQIQELNAEEFDQIYSNIRQNFQ